MLKAKKRPVFLNPFVLRLPINAVVSIVHRITGLLLFLLLPFALYALQESLLAPETYAELLSSCSGIIPKFLIWLGFSSLFYHMVAGVRHLLMDLGFGITREKASLSAMVVLGLVCFFSAAFGGWLCWG